MPFLEPATLRSIPENSLPFPDVSRDDPGGNMEIFKLWDAKGLLSISLGDRPRKEQSRVFGCFKNDQSDCVIGDCREANALEGAVIGPCSSLPPGCLLTQLSPIRYKKLLVGASTDRSDFYRQVLVSSERARSNCVGPVWPFLISRALVLMLASSLPSVKMPPLGEKNAGMALRKAAA